MIGLLIRSGMPHSGRAMLEEELRDAFVAHCSARQTPVEVDYNGESRSVDISESCSALAAWDGLFLIESQGAHVWRETLGAGIFDVDDLWEGGDLFSTPFDPDQPVDTPSGLLVPTEEERDYLLESMAIATLRLQEVNITPTDKLGDIQYQKKGGIRHPILGSAEWEGTLSIAVYSG